MLLLAFSLWALRKLLSKASQQRNRAEGRIDSGVRVVAIERGHQLSSVLSMSNRKTIVFFLTERPWRRKVNKVNDRDLDLRWSIWCITNLSSLHAEMNAEWLAPLALITLPTKAACISILLVFAEINPVRFIKMLVSELVVYSVWLTALMPEIKHHINRRSQPSVRCDLRGESNGVPPLKLHLSSLVMMSEEPPWIHWPTRLYTLTFASSRVIIFVCCYTATFEVN